MSFAAACFLVLAHSQDFLPVAALISVVVFVCVCGGRYPCVSVFRSLDFVIGLALAFFSILIAWVQCDDLIRENPIGYFASDGRATYIFIFYLAMRFSLASRPQAYRELVSAGVLVATLIALISCVAYFYGPINIADQSVGVMPASGGYVAVGLLGTKNSFSGNNTAALVLAFSLLLIKPRLNVMPRSLLVGCAGCLALGLVLSGSRGYLLGALAGIGLILLCFRNSGRPSRRQFIGGLILGIGCISVLSTAFVAANPERMERLGSGQDANVVRRFKLFEYAFSLWGKSTIAGIGPGSLMQPDLSLRETHSPWFAKRLGGAKTEYGEWMWVGDLPVGQHAHNQLLQLLVDYGLIGLALLAALLLAGIRGGVFRSHDPIDDEQRSRRRLAVVSLMYVVVAGASAGYTLTSASIAWSTWVLIAGCRTADGSDDEELWFDDEEFDGDAMTDQPDDFMSEDDAE